MRACQDKRVASTPMLLVTALLTAVAAHPCNRDTTVLVEPHKMMGGVPVSTAQPGYQQVWRMRTESAVVGFNKVNGHVTECFRGGAPYGDVPCGQLGTPQCGVDETSASKSCQDKAECEVRANYKGSDIMNLLLPQSHYNHGLLVCPPLSGLHAVTSVCISAPTRQHKLDAVEHVRPLRGLPFKRGK
jgi:hypothetical protein